MPTVRTLLAIAAALLTALGPAPGSAAPRPNPHADLDCAYCHQDRPRFGIDTRSTVNFWGGAGDEPALCERCHSADQNFHPLGITPGPKCMDTVCPVSLPLGMSDAVKDQVVCTTCHFLHAADADHALLRGFPGSDRPNLFRNWQDLCRQCHGTNLEKRSPHDGDERSCAFCHPAKPAPGRPATVKPAGRRLCEFCHGFMGKEHYAGVNPFAQPQECVGCHDPHLGKDVPARLRKGYFDPIRESVTLNPHRKRTLCFACHTGPEGKQLRSADPVALCQRCHASGQIAGMSHPLKAATAGVAIPKGWPLVNNTLTCLTCHLPGHTGEDRKLAHLLRGGSPEHRNEVCFQCHKRDQWKGRNPHREAAKEEKGCDLCHARDPDVDPEAFVADINILCLACHDAVEHPGGVEHTLTLAGASTEIPPGFPLGRGGRITCATCHDPMEDKSETHNLRGAAVGTAFCTKCHKL